jgi:hypothetical protein
MRSFVAACVAAVLVALAAAYVLNGYQQPAGTAFSSAASVRI